MNKQVIVIVFCILATHVAFCAHQANKIVKVYDLSATTQLYEAIKADNKKLVVDLLPKNVDLNGKDGAGYTPLAYAKSLGIVKKLFKSGARFSVNDNGENFFHIAAQDNKPIEVFLYAGNECVSACGQEKINGNTPMHLLSFLLCDRLSRSRLEEEEFLKKVSILSWFQGCPDIKNKHGFTPISILSQQCANIAARVQEVSRQMSLKRDLKIAETQRLVRSALPVPGLSENIVGYVGVPGLSLSDLE